MPVVELSEPAASLRAQLGVEPDAMLLLTHISGTINGEAFQGHGVGMLKKGLSQSRIWFDHFPTTFTPLACSSWKCKNHKPGPDPGFRPETPVHVMSAYTEEAAIAYKKGAKGVIYTKGVVKRLGNTASLCFNVFEGHYDGPTKVEEVFPWEVSYKTISGNRYQVTCYRQFKAEGTLVEATWNGLLVIEDGYLPAECALIFSQEAFSWENPTKDGQAFYSETLRLRTRWS